MSNLYWLTDDQWTAFGHSFPGATGVQESAIGRGLEWHHRVQSQRLTPARLPARVRSRKDSLQPLEALERDGRHRLDNEGPVGRG